MMATDVQAWTHDEQRASVLLRTKAKEVLEDVRWNRLEARELLRKWIREDEEISNLMNDPSIGIAINAAIRERFAADKAARRKLADERPVVTNFVALDGPARARERAIPEIPAVRSAASATMFLKGMGLMGECLPGTDKQVGLAKAWEIKKAMEFFRSQRIGHGTQERYFALLWQSLPDRNEPEFAQKEAREYLKEDDLVAARAQAKAAEESRTL